LSIAPDILGRLIRVSLAIADTGKLRDVCAALEAGRFSMLSGAATISDIAGGNTNLECQLRPLQNAWRDIGSDLSGSDLSLVLLTASGAVSEAKQTVPVTEVVWTGPRIEQSYIRATREIVREILRSAQKELLVVGYWIAAGHDEEGIIREFINATAEALARGVSVRIILDERIRDDGQDNRKVLLGAWPRSFQEPELLTWRLPVGDRHLKLHAKLLVADRRDALVTSANLTSYGMGRNMEMGVRVVGQPAADISKHFDIMIARGVIEPYDRREV
jgi:cardiolipin synthase